MFSIKYLCKLAGVSRSGYYNYLNSKETREKNEKRDYENYKLIKEAFDYRGRSKGARSIKMYLQRKKDIIFNLKRIRRLMRKFGLVCSIRKANPYKKMIRAIQTSSICENKVKRHFNQGVAGKIFLTDITYLFYGKGLNKRAYLSTVKDAGTTEIVAYNPSKTMELPIVLDTIHMLIGNKLIEIDKNALIHSDQGAHYTSKAFQDLLKKVELEQSMSRRGNCWDNAPQESFYGHMKDELHLDQCETFEELCEELDDYFDYYNNDRYQWDLGMRTPKEYREYLKYGDGYFLMEIKQSTPIGVDCLNSY